MKLGLIMDEVAEACRAFTKLNVFAYPPADVKPPACVVSYPEQIVYDESYGRGYDRVSGLPVILVVGKANDGRNNRDQVTAWADGDAAGLKRFLETYPYTSCDVVSVTDATFDVITIAAVDYIAVMLSLDLSGRGA